MSNLARQTKIALAVKYALRAPALLFLVRVSVNVQALDAHVYPTSINARRKSVVINSMVRFWSALKGLSAMIAVPISTAAAKSLARPHA